MVATSRRRGQPGEPRAGAAGRNGSRDGASTTPHRAPESPDVKPDVVTEELSRVYVLETTCEHLRTDIAIVDERTHERLNVLESQQYELAAQLGHLREMVATSVTPVDHETAKRRGWIEPRDPVAALEQLEAKLSNETPPASTRDRAPSSRGDTAATGDSSPRWQAGDPPAPARVSPDEYVCPNCVTPWKCNGPHLAEGTWCEAPGGYVVVGTRVLMRLGSTGWWEGTVVDLDAAQDRPGDGPVARVQLERGGAHAVMVRKLALVPEGE